MLQRGTLGALVGAAVLLAGCAGGSGPPMGPSPAGVRQERTHVRPAYGVIYSFKGGGDGDAPTADFLKFKGTLYGTTYSGGADGEGVVYSITPSGAETVLHSFGIGSGDGAVPYADVITSTVRSTAQPMKGVRPTTERSSRLRHLATNACSTASGASTTAKLLLRV
jgi:uncharacterized repeat protein (TIGR03803 family)